jgi:hypothetical protein
MRNRVRFIIALFFIIGTNSLAFSQSLHYWTQLAPHSELIARIITSADNCPSLRVEGKLSKMTKRATPTARFPNLLCEHRLPSLVSNVSLEGKPLAVLKPEVKRIAVVGDTGCRIRGQRAQACNNPNAWPLRKITDAIMAQNPDLVIHVGDYIYRGSPCPPTADCLGSPFGDNMQTWAADWLAPAQKLLSQVPFVFVRGNHEACGRNGEGWFRYLATGPVPDACLAASAPWKALLGDLNLIVFDASDGRAPQSSETLKPVYKRMAEFVFKDLEQETWFLTHRPLWAYMRAFGEIVNGDDTQREVVGPAIPEAVNLILSGHIHAFQALDIVHHPTQIITGNGGTLLDPMPTDMRDNFEVADSKIEHSINDGSFGFSMLIRNGRNAWQLEALDVDGIKKIQCDLKGRQMSCKFQ